MTARPEPPRFRQWVGTLPAAGTVPQCDGPDRLLASAQRRARDTRVLTESVKLRPRRSYGEKAAGLGRGRQLQRVVSAAMR